MKTQRQKKIGHCVGPNAPEVGDVYVCTTRTHAFRPEPEPNGAFGIRFGEACEINEGEHVIVVKIGPDRDRIEVVLGDTVCYLYDSQLVILFRHVPMPLKEE